MRSAAKLFRPLKHVVLGATGSALVLAGIGAQSVEAAPLKLFLASLNGAQQTPPSASNGHGNALLRFDASTSMLCFDIAYSGLGSAEILATILGPAAPDVGPGMLQFGLPTFSPKNGCVGPLNSTQKRDLWKGLYYINIHTAGLPGGEIRGQILRIK